MMNECEFEIIKEVWDRYHHMDKLFLSGTLDSFEKQIIFDLWRATRCAFRIFLNTLPEDEREKIVDQFNARYDEHI